MERGFIVLFSAQKVKSNDSYLSSRRTQDLMGKNYYKCVFVVKFLL